MITLQIFFNPMKHKINRKWLCPDCPSDEIFFLDFDTQKAQGQDVFRLLSKYEKLECPEGHKKKHFLTPGAECFFFSCDYGVSVNLQHDVSFQGKLWKVKSVIGQNGSIFFNNKSYFQVTENEIVKCESSQVINAIIIVFEVWQDNIIPDEKFCYKGNELRKIRDILKRTEDRHKNPNDDRHKNPNEDRHITPQKGDRHKNRKENILNELKTDTGMETVCCICAELKSSKSCSLADSMPREKFEEFLIDLKITRNLDGKLYICNVCKTSIQNNKKPIRAQKEFLGLLDYPDNFKEKLPSICQPNPRILDEKKLVKLNKGSLIKKLNIEPSTLDTLFKLKHFLNFF